ncbi:MAG: transposase [Methanobrevibacter sp.]
MIIDNNSRKISNEKRSRLLNNLSNPKITEINSKEKRINIILDNARTHHAKIVEKACEILNINLIFLKPYCPDLNPIKEVWRKIKSKVYKSIYKNLNELIEIFEAEFYKTVDLTSFYTS